MAGGCWGEGAYYSLSGNRITLTSVEHGHITTFTSLWTVRAIPPHTRSAHGSGMRSSAYNPWIKIG